MPKYTYKNTTDQELVIPNVGVVKAGDTITTEVEVDNPNLELKKEVKDKDKK